MNSLLNLLFRTNQPVPDKYQANFSHLYLDVIWWGILNGTTLSFLAIYAVRLGATPGEIGWLNAVPAVVSLVFALPVGHWFSRRPPGKEIFWASVANRIFYLLFLLIPWFMTDRSQVVFIILATLVMSIPMTFFTVGFNSLFADAVPGEWRGYVVTVRNAAISIMTVIVSLISGQILNRIAFPGGYQIVFLLGFVGSAVSSYHLWFIHPHPNGRREGGEAPTAVLDAAELEPGQAHPVEPVKNGRMAGLRLDVLKTPFGRVLFLLFFFHLSQYLGIPIFPLYQVNYVHFSDQVISIGVGVFNFMVFIGSTQLIKFFGRHHNRVLMGFGVVLMGLYPALMAFSRNLGMFALTSFEGGIAWSIVGGTLYNFLVDRVPVSDRPAYMAWYHLALNAAILLGSLGGPYLATLIGLPGAMLVCAVARLIAGLAILQWG